MAETPKKEIIFTGRLTKERLKALSEEHGLTQRPAEQPPTPQGTIFSGHLTIEKLKELCLEHLEIKSESDQYNPHKNENIITLIKQEFGHWTAQGYKNGTYKSSRELAPEHALQAFLAN